MAEQEKVGKKEFEIFLLEKKFATILNIDIISKQFSDAEEELKKSLGVKSIPSFYSDAKQYMLDNPISIDSTGKIETNIIKQITKKVEEKEIQEKQILDEERKRKENIEDNTSQEEIDEKKKYEDRIAQIKLVDDTIEKYGGIERFLKNATRDEIDQFTSLRKEQQIFDEVDEIIVRMINNPDYELTLDEQEKLSKSPQGQEFQYNSDNRKLKDSEKAEMYIIQLDNLKSLLKDIAIGNNGMIDFNEINKYKSQENFSLVFQIKNDEELKKMINETEKEVKSIKLQQENSQKEFKPNERPINVDTAKMQENAEISMQQKMKEAPDYAEEEKILKDEQSAEEIHTREGISAEDLLQNLEFGLTDELNDFQIENTKDKKEIQTEDQPQQEPSKENKYETPTFEVKSTGLAGLFSRIANSRAAKAVTNLFKPKEEQKKLNAPVNQRVEDGVRFTDYESNGSLLPATIQTRNFFRNFAVSTVEAVANFAKNISGRTKKENETIVNNPTVIKSEPVKEDQTVELGYRELSPEEKARASGLGLSNKTQTVIVPPPNKTQNKDDNGVR